MLKTLSHYLQSDFRFQRTCAKKKSNRKELEIEQIQVESDMLASSAAVVVKSASLSIFEFDTLLVVFLFCCIYFVFICMEVRVRECCLHKN